MELETGKNKEQEYLSQNAMQLSSSNQLSKNVDLSSTFLDSLIFDLFNPLILSGAGTLFVVSKVLTCVMMKGWSMSFLRSEPS